MVSLIVSNVLSWHVPAVLSELVGQGVCLASLPVYLGHNHGEGN